MGSLPAHFFLLHFFISNSFVRFVSLVARFWFCQKLVRFYRCTHIAAIYQYRNQQAILVENEKMSNDLLSRRFNAFLTHRTAPKSIHHLYSDDNANKYDSISTMDLFKAGNCISVPLNWLLREKKKHGTRVKIIELKSIGFCDE